MVTMAQLQVYYLPLVNGIKELLSGPLPAAGRLKWWLPGDKQEVDAGEAKVGVVGGNWISPTNGR